MKSETIHRAEVPKEAKRSQGMDRDAFWRYCVATANSTRQRSRRRRLPYAIDAFMIDGLLVDQNWKCAVSGIDLASPSGVRTPFGPSLDRIVPALGYVPGNVRVVCNVVNFAMNEWGEEPLRQLVAAIRAT